MYSMFIRYLDRIYRPVRRWFHDSRPSGFYRVTHERRWGLWWWVPHNVKLESIHKHGPYLTEQRMRTANAWRIEQLRQDFRAKMRRFEARLGEELRKQGY